MKQTFIIHCILSCFLLSCSNRCLDDWHSTHLIHDFYLEWYYHPKSQHITEGSWNCGVGGNEPLTDNTVFAVGYDTSFIIAKLHPDASEEIRKRLFVDSNVRGDFSVASVNDTLYLHDNKFQRDSVYLENGKWYHTSKDWSRNSDSLYIDKSKTIFYIIDIKDYPQKWYSKDRVTKYKDEDSFLQARKRLGVANELDFTLVDSDLQ